MKNVKTFLVATLICFAGVVYSQGPVSLVMPTMVSWRMGVPLDQNRLIWGWFLQDSSSGMYLSVQYNNPTAFGASTTAPEGVVILYRKENPELYELILNALSQSSFNIIQHVGAAEHKAVYRVFTFDVLNGSIIGFGFKEKTHVYNP